MALGEIRNFIQLDDRTGLGGQPTAEQLEAGKAEGYEAVVNLAPTSPALEDEDAVLRALGLDYHHIPVAWTEPRMEDLDRFVAVMDGLGGRKTLVHCAANFRVTAFYSLYAMQRLGWSAAEADALMARVWQPSVPGGEIWQAFVAQARARIAAAA